MGFLPAFFAVLVSTIFCFYSNQSFATHAAGADLTYQCLGGLVYQVDATFYRDCGGTSEPGNITITYKSAACGFTRTALANKVLVNNGTEITMPCATSPSTCGGGISTGIRKWVYRTVITLPAACSDWVFSYRVCCRNCSISTIQNPCASGSEVYVEATLNNQAASCNSSPVFSNIPIAFVCLGQNFNFNQGVYDPDGDSISYELITPKTSAIAEVTFIPPATQFAPVNSSTPFLLNSVTGDINFTPSSLQISILAVRVKEYRDGQLVGSTIRDMQIYTQNCSNAIPAASGINGSSDFIAEVCADQQLCFTIHTSDVDTMQQVSVLTSNPIQGAIINQTPGNRPDIQFCWTPTQNDISANPHVFTVTVYDNACPFNGVQTFSYALYVQGPINTISLINPTCYGGNNGSASVSVSGNAPFTYVWNTIPPQTNAFATGLSSGNYSVVVTDVSGCLATSNIAVIDPPVSITTNCTVSGINSCQAGNNASIQVNTTGGTGPYYYQWNNGAITSSISNLGSGVYTVTVTDAGGCSTGATGIIPQAAGAVSATISTSSNVLCYGGNSGSIGLSVLVEHLPTVISGIMEHQLKI
ncbi:MAG: SprB repeat-containing protein [Bacteroidetes bacterium]|nr:SprB repeat-containing protein [Bacteroidota bacterium]